VHKSAVISCLVCAQKLLNIIGHFPCETTRQQKTYDSFRCQKQNRTQCIPHSFITKYTANYDIQVTTSKQKSRDQQDMIQQILLKINRM